MRNCKRKQEEGAERRVRPRIGLKSPLLGSIVGRLLSLLGCRAKPKAAPKPVMILDLVANMCITTLEAFFDLKMVLLFRETSRYWNRYLNPKRKFWNRKLWSRISPPLWEFIPRAPAMTVASANMFESIYEGEQRNTYEKILITAACSSGNVALIQRHWVNNMFGPPIDKYMRVAVRFGQIGVLRWMAEYKRQNEERMMVRHRAFMSADDLTTAAGNGDIAAGTWLLENVAELGPYEDGFNLLQTACICEHYEFAAWVLQKFPIAPATEELVEFISAYIYTAKFLIEAFDLGWEELRGTIQGYCHDYFNNTLYRKRSYEAARWLSRRFAAEIAEQCSPDRPGVV